MPYTPLTRDQFEKAQKSGFSTDQIIQFEQRRKQEMTATDAQSQQVQDQQNKPQGFLGTVGNIAKGVGNFFTGSEQGTAKAGASAYGTQQYTSEQATQNGQSAGQLITEAHKLPMGDPRRSQLLQQAMQIANQGADQAQENQQNIPSTMNAGLDIAGTAADILSAGTYGKATKAMEAGKLFQKAAPTVVTATEKLGQEAAQKTGGIFSRMSSKIGEVIKGKPLKDILSTPESELYKLNPTERSTWFKNAQEQLINKSKQVEQGIAKDLQKKSLTSQLQAEQLQKELATTTRDKVIELRPKIIKAMGEQSATYRKLVEKDMAGKGKLIVSPSEIRTYVTNRYGDNPQMASAVIDRLGLNDAKVNTTVERIFNQAKSLKQELSSGARTGTKTFTANDKLTDDAISTLTGYLKDAKGVDFKNANQFWAKYAPIRNQLVSEAKPFVQSGTQTKTFASTLSRVAKGNDVNNENFINEVENLLKQPINQSAKDVVSKMSSNEKTALADKISAESAKLENQMAKDSSLKNLNSRQFEVERTARLRDVMKKVLKSLPGIAAGDVILKRITGIGF